LPYAKRHEKCVLFLEDAFGTTVHREKLEAAGYTVECFAKVFSVDGRRPEQGVKDPKIIRYCHREKRILVTTDKNMRFTHVEEIKRTSIGIIATESNRSPTGMGVWVEALILAKAQIERTVKKHARPWFAHLSRTGKISKVETITAEMRTRRTRPNEH
jgi:predicted nuclease of predicted toxin-antitoxin system